MISVSSNIDPMVILLAEDDEDDYLFFKEATNECSTNVDLRWVKNGEEALNYLLRRNSFKDPELSPTPKLIFLDIKMPVKSGLDVVPEVKQNPMTNKIPVIMVTTSNNERDVIKAYENGANSYINKPQGIDQLQEFKNIIKNFWSPLVLFP
ncbi:MAG: response regulator [Candidatus Nitrohelix vancouverensis]|uniref:Response regulator n=1 Tax=Candidatus Nitrohelix vancouverensis TaxID=2705534 RepID=A0A7T0C3N7_9BACT|nr:MAG: response regulator [Candidatus Nitrohelix vancouverensis]